MPNGWPGRGRVAKTLVSPIEFWPRSLASTGPNPRTNAQAASGSANRTKMRDIGLLLLHLHRRPRWAELIGRGPATGKSPGARFSTPGTRALLIDWHRARADLAL